MGDAVPHTLVDAVPDVRRGGAPCAHRPVRSNRGVESRGRIARVSRPSAQSSDESSSSLLLPLLLPVSVSVSVSGFGGLDGFGRAPGLSRR